MSGSGPPDKWTNTLNLSGYTTDQQVEDALSAAWDAFHTAYGVFPSVWIVLGTKVVYGGY